MHNELRTAGLMAVLIMLVALIGYALGGNSGLVIAFAVAMNFFSYWYSDKIVLKMYRGQEVTRAEAPGLVDLIDELWQRVGLPMPEVVVIPSE